MTILNYLTDPFTHYAFMRRALVACVVLSLGGTPLGVFMNLRRMSLVGDAMAHAILPGVAVAFLACGLAVWPLTIGGLITGILVAGAAVFLTRYTQLKEDASFTLLYLLSLAGGVTLITIKGNNIDLMHMLFGDILAIDTNALILVTASTCISLLVIAALYRRLVLECFDPDFLHSLEPRGGWTSLVFFGLLMINLIAAFQALGTLMALGLMLLPAIAARFWTRTVDTALPLSVGLALVSSVTGLLVSYYGGLPSGASVVLAAGLIALFSALIGRSGSVYDYMRN